MLSICSQTSARLQVSRAQIASDLLHILIGGGDGVSTGFVGTVRAPVIPGSVVIRVMMNNAVDRLAALTDPTASALMSAIEMQNGTGVLLQQKDGGSINAGVVNHQTGQWRVNWLSPPPPGSIIQVLYRRELHRLHGARVLVQLPDGTTEWIDLQTLDRAINLA